MRATRSLPARILGVNQRLTAGLDLQHQRDDRVNYGNNAGVPDTVRQLDQLEQVLEIGPFVQTAIPLDPRTSLTFGLRFDRVSFTADDRLVTASNPDDSGERIMQAFSGSLGVTRDLGNGASGDDPLEPVGELGLIVTPLDDGNCFGGETAESQFELGP